MWMRLSWRAEAFLLPMRRAGVTPTPVADWIMVATAQAVLADALAEGARFAVVGGGAVGGRAGREAPLLWGFEVEFTILPGKLRGFPSRHRPGPARPCSQPMPSPFTCTGHQDVSHPDRAPGSAGSRSSSPFREAGCF